MRSHPLQALFAHLVQDLKTLCVCKNGEVLFSSSHEPALTALLPQAISSLQTFFKLKPGDIALLQDPLAGGPGRGAVALVYQYESFAVATQFVHHQFEKGLFPPAPLRLEGQLIEGVKSALSLAQKDLLALVEKLTHLEKVFHSPLYKDLFSDKKLAHYLAKESEYWQNKLSELPEKDVTCQTQVDQLKTYKIKLSCHQSQVQFDLSGTSPADGSGLPLAATSGILWSMLLDAIGEPQILNSALIKHLPILSAQNSALSLSLAKADLNLKKDQAQLQGAIYSLLQKWLIKSELPPANPFDLKIELTFKSGKNLKLELPAGSSAYLENNGVCFTQQRPYSKHLSIEALEAEYPLIFRSAGERTTALNAPLKPGAGLSLVFEVRENATLTLPCRTQSAKDKEFNIKDKCENELIQVQRQSEFIKIDHSTALPLELRSGDILHLQSAGGY